MSGSQIQASVCPEGRRISERTTGAPGARAEDSGDADEASDGDSWQAALLEVLRKIEPATFERLCQRLLREHGFARVEVTGRSDDGGIDGTGVLRLNPADAEVYAKPELERAGSTVRAYSG